MAKVKMSVEVSEELRDKLAALARGDGRSTMRYIEKLLETHVDRKEKAA